MPKMLYKSYSPEILAVFNDDFEVYSEEETEEIIDNIKQDITYVSAVSQFLIAPELLKEYESFVNSEKCTSSIPNAVGKLMKINIPKKLVRSPQAGRSRLEYMVRDRVIRELSSWSERRKAASGESNKYISQGWKRTFNASKPRNLKPKMSLSAAGPQYAKILNDYVEDGFIDMKMVAGGKWYTFRFAYPQERFKRASKLCLPDVIINKNGEIKFNFAVGYVENKPGFNPDYFVVVDVGISDYITAGVVRASNGEIVEVMEVSQLLKTLENKAKKAHKQISTLQKTHRKEESKPHRESNVNRKRELAIQAAQEVADFAFKWGNATIIVEDLSWIKNTMQNGRWNRGEFIKWLKHFAELNGSRVMNSNAKDTSQKCWKCGSKVTHPTWGTSQCINKDCEFYHVIQDRDICALSVIAQNFIKPGSFEKAVQTRKKSKSKFKKKEQRSPKITRAKVPRKDRTKHKPTKKRKKTCIKRVQFVRLEVKKFGGSRGFTVPEKGCSLHKEVADERMTDIQQPKRRLKVKGCNLRRCSL